MRNVRISIVSFSYKRGLPEDDIGNGGGFVFDCRAMPNPFWDESLRGFSGCDKPVVDFFEQHKDKVNPFLEAAERLVRLSIDQYLADGREHLQVAFGCTGNAPALYISQRDSQHYGAVSTMLKSNFFMPQKHIGKTSRRALKFSVWSTGMTALFPNRTRN